jgi:hypothetical protein
MSIEDRITSAGLQQSGGAQQTITEAGLEAWINSVNGYRNAGGGKKLFTQDRVERIATSRRDVD